MAITAPPPLQPSDGVIKEARRRQYLRRTLTAVAGILLLGVVALLLASMVSRGTASKAPPPNAASRPSLAHSGSLMVSLSPNLEPGRPGWCVSAAVRGVPLRFGCAFLLTHAHPFLGEGWAWAPGARYATSLVLTPPRVSSILVDGDRVPTRTVPGVPLGLRVARMEAPAPIRPVRGSARLAQLGGKAPTPIATRVITVDGKRSTEGAETQETMPVRYWKQPEAQPGGLCELHASTLSGLVNKWGGVVTAIRSTPDQIVGAGFVPCLDTGYVLNGHALQAAVLLDAAQPGHKTPGPIPGVAAIPQDAAFYNTAAILGYVEPLTAKRQGNAWVVVAGGGSNAQQARVKLLGHLTASVRL